MIQELAKFENCQEMEQNLKTTMGALKVSIYVFVVRAICNIYHILDVAIFLSHAKVI